MQSSAEFLQTSGIPSGGRLSGYPRASTSNAQSPPSQRSNDNIPSPTNTSAGFTFPPPVGRPAQRASIIRQRRSSPLLHEIQSPSRRLSAHQMLLLTPFGGPLPMEATSTSAGTGMGRMARGSSSMGGPGPPPRAGSLGMASTTSSVGFGRHDMTSPIITSRAPPSLSTRFNARHQSLVQPVNSSPLSQPLATIQSTSDYGSESESSSLAISREPSNSSDTSEDEDVGVNDRDSGRLNAARRLNAMAVDMMRSNSLPVLTQRELDAMQDKDGELGIARGTHWAWVQDDDREEVQMESPVPRTTPPSRPFAFQDPFAPLGTSAIPAVPSTRYVPTTTSSDYHYSPTAEARRMSEVNNTTWQDTSPGSRTVNQSRGTSVATITLSSSISTLTPGSHSPSSSSQTIANSPPFPVPAFNSRASMSALEQTPLIPLAGLELPTAPIRPRILRYKTSPARFTGLGLHLVVKSQPQSGSNSSGASVAGAAASSAPSRRRSSVMSIDHDRRRSSGTNSASSNESRRGTWAVVDVVDTLSSTNTVDISRPSTTSTSASTPASTSASVYTSTSSSIQSLRTNPESRVSMPNTVYTVEHVSSRSSPGSDRFKSLPSRKGRLPSGSVLAYDTISPLPLGMVFNDPLAFPRRGSLAVLSQTALGPWAARHVVDGVGGDMEELLDAPKGNWQDRRGSWAEGWSKAPV